MILYDTNIIIDNWKKIKKYSDKQLSEITICGVVETEFLYGSISEQDTENMLKFFESVNFISMEDSDWIYVGKFLLNLRKKGIQIPTTDAIIAYLAIKNDCPVFTNDKHFKLIKQIYPKLELFSEK